MGTTRSSRSTDTRSRARLGLFRGLGRERTAGHRQHQGHFAWPDRPPERFGRERRNRFAGPGPIPAPARHTEWVQADRRAPVRAVLGVGPWSIAIAFGAPLGSRLLGLFTPQTLVCWGLVLLCLGIGVLVRVLSPKMEGGVFLVPSYSSRPPLRHGAQLSLGVALAATLMGLW